MPRCAAETAGKPGGGGRGSKGQGVGDEVREITLWSGPEH